MTRNGVLVHVCVCVCVCVLNSVRKRKIKPVLEWLNSRLWRRVFSPRNPAGFTSSGALMRCSISRHATPNPRKWQRATAAMQRHAAVPDASTGCQPRSYMVSLSFLKARQHEEGSPTIRTVGTFWVKRDCSLTLFVVASAVFNVMCRWNDRAEECVYALCTWLFNHSGRCCFHSIPSHFSVSLPD